MYSKIINPKTGRKVNVNGKLGKSIIRNYLVFLNGGEFGKKTKEALRRSDNNRQYKHQKKTLNKIRNMDTTERVEPTPTQEIYNNIMGLQLQKRLNKLMS